ncbi:hypothetical protein CYLTODRAFT_487177 [Cylindrobasidium torrendii FP15055 ss-10]|uniref:Uncharacterized protein n=1 Tax=Cylindrobasidium torrendii FP15055 ss-10 TaxID=1314674 RepID=A0A0D7BLT4_9AGAR|nr:hypothetical protein CYLTODRAFT_487177 [Cylindrobasidium torrendii FP15055 ss-10]
MFPPRWVLPLLLSPLASAAVASPPAVAVLSGNTIVLISVLFGLGLSAVLVGTAKFYFVKQRRASLMLHSECKVSAGCSAQKMMGVHYQPWRSLFPCPTSQEDSIAGYLIGLFGEPEMETQAMIRSKIVDIRSILSSSTRSASTWNSNTMKESTTTRIGTGETFKRDANEFGENLSDWPTSSSLSRGADTLPSYYEPSSDYAPNNSTGRSSKNLRTSSPALSSNHAEQVTPTPKPRRSSLRSHKSRRSSTSVRILDPADEIPMPLSPSEAAISARKFFEDALPASRRQQSISRLPSLPESQHAQSISRPYPLSRRSRDRQVPPLPLHTPSLNAPTEGQSGRSRSLLSSTTFWSDPPSPRPDMPIPPLPTSVIKQRPSIRKQRSPSLGPSPLRLMSLPEGEISCKDNVGVSNPKAQTIDGLPSRYSFSSITAVSGLPVSRSARSSQIIFDASEVDDEKRSSVSSTMRITHMGSDDGTKMLGLLRDLVEDTNNWNVDLYMEENFREMLGAQSNPPRSENESTVEGSSLD